MAGRADSPGSARPPRRDHRAGRPQDGHQRLEFRRLYLHGGLRGLHGADLGQPRGRPGQPDRRGAGHHRIADGGQELPVARADRDLAGAPARLAFARGARAAGRRADRGGAVRLRSVLLPQRRGTVGAPLGALLLPAQAAKPSGSAAVERRVRACATDAWHSARQRARDGADRDAAGGVRDARDPVGTEGPLGRAELRALGLHLQLYQDAA